MPFYEHVMIARQDISPQQVDALTQSYKELIASLGGKVEKTEYWGLRSFAFRMKRHRKGHYVLMNLEAPPAAIKELERQEHINEDVLRSLTVRVAALDPEPSPIMQRGRDRDERGGGRGRDRERGRGARFDEAEEPPAPAAQEDE
jgi:small subunit ribosomal protein S6